MGNKKSIIFTGGGSGGHVVPAITLIKYLASKGEYSFYYIGGRNSIERELTASLDLKYFPIYTVKLRRYFSFENFTDLLRILLGLFQSFFIMLKFSSNDTLVFSMGGFVSVPVVIGARLTGKKIYIHEQTSRAGLANKICSKFADKVFVSFEESIGNFDKKKTIVSGYPVRPECYVDDVGKVEINGFDLKRVGKPILFLSGGGNGSHLINSLIKGKLEELTKKYFIVHQVGRDHLLKFRNYNSDSYQAMDFIDDIIGVFKLADIIISRAGAGTVCELLALKKRSIFIPLKIAQKNEQFHNAMVAHMQIGSLVVEEDELNQCGIMDLISHFYDEKKTFTKSEPQHSLEILEKYISQAFIPL